MHIALYNRFGALQDISTSSGDDIASIYRLPKTFTIRTGTLDRMTMSAKFERKSHHSSKPSARKYAKQRRTVELRTKRAYAKIASEERKWIREQVSTSTPRVAVDATDPVYCGEKHDIRTVLLIGDWAPTGSRIKGHRRRSGKALRDQHRLHTTIGITNEHLTSKTCPFCYQRVRLARCRRLVGGKITVKRVNGAVECVNADCPSFVAGYTMKNRDANGGPYVSLCLSRMAQILFFFVALNIAIAGASTNNNAKHSDLLGQSQPKKATN
jgi:hypothetical protein